jgi:hypothetical protein
MNFQEEYPMSPRMEIKVGAKPSGELQDEAPSQRRKPDTEHFRLQVDRQTKSSHASYKAAEKAGLEIKKNHPVVSVSVYDTVEGLNTLINLPNSSGELAS